MRARYAISLFAILCALRTETLSANGDTSTLIALESSVRAVYEENKDAVARIKVATRAKTESGEETTALTVLSGFFIDSEGTVLSNAIPQNESSRVWIEKDGVQYLAVVIATDPNSNLSLVKAAKPPKQTAFIPLEQEVSESAIGSIAIAITSPLNFDPTPKWGLVTGHECQFSNIEFPFSYTRVSISSGPAEGGSPVFNINGQFIGISVASLPEIESSYLVPTRAIARMIEYLSNKRAFPHADLGITFEEKGSLSDTNKRVFIKTLDPKGKAAQSGLKVGDHILSVAESVITEKRQLKDLLFYSERDSFIPITIQRQDQTVELAVLIPAN